MSSFKLKAGLTQVFLPGVGKVVPNVVLAGDHLRKFVPQFLVEVVETPPAPEAAVVAAPVVVAPAPPAPASAPVVAAPVAPAPKPAALAPESPSAGAPAIIEPKGAEPVRPKKEKKR